MKRCNGGNRLSPAGWFALLVLVAFLAAAILYAVRVWQATAGAHISLFGWISLVLGVVFTIALGSGLMGLCFYSSRHDLDR